MKKESNKAQSNDFLSMKTVIRTKDFEASKRFYAQILGLEIVEEYSGEKGVQGCILRIGESNAMIEISEISENHDYYQKAFSDNFKDDKTDLQIRTNDVNYWSTILKEKWEAKGPVLRPWGSYYLYLRDPDGLQIIIYQEKK